jgi:hypothetical protein
MGRRTVITPRIRLTATQIRRMVKPRGGFKLPVQGLIELFDQRRDVLLVKGFDAAKSLARLKQYEDLVPVVRDKKLDFEMTADAQLQLSSEIWREGLTLYQHAKVVARTDPRVKAFLAPFVAFMKKGRKKRKPRTRRSAKK